MAILTNVKQALGIYYDEPTKNIEIQTMIDGAKDYLLRSGWPADELAVDEETPSAIQAIIIYAKMAANTDPTEMKQNPVLISMIVQARMRTSE